ncbi:hypothetical protein CEXT_364411 [Caerostris extrusa]|uniref:Uncharacterized protein n=1 Tax=Caerostris extrusa TaxID=172846 RepID=A0AAV4M6H3_CAEEX|nr:hypothetical protein CEXT_364411 [Caerostris extrusa]
MVQVSKEIIQLKGYRSSNTLQVQERKNVGKHHNWGDKTSESFGACGVGARDETSTLQTSEPWVPLAAQSQSGVLAY